MFFLGMDTSNYVTSMAVIQAGPEDFFRLHWEKRISLEVIRGGKGLRQGEAVFQHLRNMPLLWEEAAEHLPAEKLKGIAASIRPRPVEGSYMPVFQVGKSFGGSAAALLGIPFYACSHQEGHIAAGVWSARCFARDFLALHLSGGTTELLQVNRVSRGEFQIRLLGGTTDLNAGQFVDRIGVKLGFSFPAGRELEQLAARSKEGGLKVPVFVKGYDTSFSGPATFAERAIDEGAPAAEVARGVEVCLARSLLEIVRKAARDKELKSVLVVGGIAANAFIRKNLVEGLPLVKFFFPEPAFAGDNAVGAALLAGYNMA
ncbi:MAG: O-sialoglycoprotein endopeptidase [Dethiobacter sp.]|jgi:N6-L-threonylcarbamoyladenine synthase|nr:MAG: O-sialoglycoprotein endopeptidase [Dethiobacter sp.]